MKIYWGLRPSPRKVQERIAALERELGIDDKTVLAEVEALRLERKQHRGPVLLGRASDLIGPRRDVVSGLASRGLIGSGAAQELELRPGFKWPVFEPSDVQFVTASAYSLGVVAPKSRVVLPAGVRV